MMGQKLSEPTSHRGVSWLVLAHDRPDLVGKLVNGLLQSGGCVVVHWDANAGAAPLDALRRHCPEAGDRLLFAPRVRCAWGDWSLVQATINAIETLMASGDEAGHVCLIGGSSDMPIRPRAEFEAFLHRHPGREFIESWPADTANWVKGGPQAERYRYYYPFNWRSQHRLAARLFRFQQRLGVKRRFPDGFEPRIGSQWWVLTRASLLRLRELYRDRALTDFFRTTLIPDESFFQTLVQAVTPAHQIANHNLTYYQFTDYFVPLVFQQRHYDYLLRQPFFFARKIGLDAGELRTKLAAHWESGTSPEALPDSAFGIRSDTYEAFIRDNRYGNGAHRSLWADFMSAASLRRTRDHHSPASRRLAETGIRPTDEWHTGRRHHALPMLIVAASHDRADFRRWIAETRIPSSDIAVVDPDAEAPPGRDAVLDLLHRHRPRAVLLRVDAAELWNFVEALGVDIRTEVVLLAATPNDLQRQIAAYVPPERRVRVSPADTAVSADALCEMKAHLLQRLAAGSRVLLPPAPWLTERSPGAELGLVDLETCTDYWRKSP